MPLELYQKNYFRKKIILIPKSPFDQKGAFYFYLFQTKLTPAQLWGNIF